MKYSRLAVNLPPWLGGTSKLFIRKVKMDKEETNNKANVDKEKKSESMKENDDQFDKNYHWKGKYCGHYQYGHRHGLWMIAGFVVIFFLIVGCVAFVGHGFERKANVFNREKNISVEFGGRMASGRMMGGHRGNSESSIRARLSGQVTKIDSNNVTVKTSDKEYTVIASASTSFVKNEAIAKQSDLAVDNQVTVIGPSNSDGNINAQAIIIQ
jgi:hypothetical protein